MQSIGPERRAAARLEELLRFQANACGYLGSPLYRDLLERAAAEVQGGGPVWGVLRGHENDPGGSALVLRLMGAVHRLVLAGDRASPPLSSTRSSLST